MDKEKVSLQGALYFTKLSVYLACTWPPRRTATKREIIKYHVAWYLSFLNVLCLLIPLFFSISKYSSNSLIITQSVTFVGGTSNLLIKMIIYRIHCERTQNLIRDMEDFLRNAKPHETMICQRYVKRYSTFHVFISFLNYLAATTIVCMPLVFHDPPLPTSAVYPFSVDSGVLMYVAYVHQTLAGFQCSSGVTIDCQAALMLWFAGARLEILADELRNVSDVEELEFFVRKHRKLLAYAFEVSDTMAYIALVSSMACGIAAITGGLQLFGNQPLFIKIQFAPATMIATLNLFICAWPADNLINVCGKLEKAVYNISWFDMSLKTMKNIPMILRRCQRPIIVSVGGFLPTLSLASYASFVWVLFSYFTTLHFVVSSESKK